MTEPPKDWRFLACGFDTLDLGVYVDWGRSWVELLKRLMVQKDAAQGQNAILWRECELGPCLVHAGGRAPNYRFHLQLPDYHLFLATQQTADRMPNVYVSPAAKALWLRGVSAVQEDIRLFIGELGGSILRMQISRVDLAADFLMPDGLSLEYLRSSLIPSNRKTSHYCDGFTLETFYVGSKSAPVKARLYDKAKEIIHTGGLKRWFLPIWQVEDCQDIWRVEFQVRRGKLKEFRIDSLEDLQAHASSLWKHMTAHWMTLRLPDDSNTSRRTPCLWWQAVADLANLFGPASDRQRQAANSVSAPVEWYVSHVSGCLVSFAARQDIAHVEDALLALMLAIRDYWQARDWPTAYAKKSIALGGLGDEQAGEVVHVPF